MAMSIAELLNPEAWRYRREQEMRLQIEGHKFQQRDRHHYDQMRVASDRNDIAREKARKENQVARDRLEFDIRNSIAQHDTAKKVAEIQAENNLELERLKTTGAMLLRSHEATVDTVKASYMLTVDYAQSTIKQGENLDSVLANILDQSILKEIDFEHQKALADQQEGYMEKNRRHDIITAVLRAKLERDGFTHAEITRLIVRLVDPTTATPDEDELFRRYSKWYEGQKSSLG